MRVLPSSKALSLPYSTKFRRYYREAYDIGPRTVQHRLQDLRSRLTHLERGGVDRRQTLGRSLW